MLSKARSTSAGVGRAFSRMAGRAIAAKGTKETLRHGEKKAQLAVNKAIQTYGIDNPVVKECLQILLCIARAEPGYRGRYVGERLRAVNRLIDQLAGKPKETVEHSGEVTHAIRIERIG